MLSINHTDIYSLTDYSNHLKNLTEEDKRNRFGFAVSDSTIDRLVLEMVYNNKDHELWIAIDGKEIVGFGHMAKNGDGSWELAVSVEKKHQRKGIGNKLISEMLVWAKFHKITEVFMHCIEDNVVIQHLAAKHNLKTKERTIGERTASIEVPTPNVFEYNTQLLKEQSEIINEITELRGKLLQLWFNQKL